MFASRIRGNRKLPKQRGYMPDFHRYLVLKSLGERYIKQPAHTCVWPFEEPAQNSLHSQAVSLNNWQHPSIAILTSALLNWCNEASGTQRIACQRPEVTSKTENMHIQTHGQASVYLWANAEYALKIKSQGRQQTSQPMRLNCLLCDYNYQTENSTVEAGLLR